MKNFTKLCRWRRALASIPACASLALVGCFPLPVRFPTRTTNTSSQEIDLTFLKAGSTGREEVSQKLVSIDTGVNQKEFFWGRPRVSKYREILMVGYVPVGPLDRIWSVENLLVSYDANGVVKTLAILDDSHLLQKLDSVDSGATAVLDLSSPLTLNSLSYWVHEKHRPAHSVYGPLVLSAESLECFGVTIPLNQLRNIALQNSHNPEFRVKIHFAKVFDFSKTPLHERRDNLDLRLDPPQLLLLRRYMNQAKSGTQ